MTESLVIVGAGLGGLTLARTLHYYGVSAAVYEAESSPTSRGQGGLLDMHEQTGQVALKKAGLFDSFVELVRPGEDAKRVVDRDGTVLLERPGNTSGTRPEVDRGELRAMLLESIPAEHVHWAHKIVCVTSTVEGRYEVSFANGSTVAADVVIGADGAWSKVRKLLSSAEPTYSGTCFVEISSPYGHPMPEQSRQTVGLGTLIAVSPGQGILAHHNADGTLSGYVAMNKPAEWVAAAVNASPATVAAFLDQQFREWAPTLRALITENNRAPVIRPIYFLPIAHHWSRVRGLTLLGDAAHLMSPFAGQGANLAMYDAAELADALAASPHDTEAALAAYESALFPRSAEVAQESAQNLELFFGPRAPRSVVDLFAPRA